jgi:hypothetical protein
MQLKDLTPLIFELPETEQSQHMGRTDFRVRGKIFASLPRPGPLVLKLTADQQQMLTESEPQIFQTLPNAWGAKGWTAVEIERLDVATARSGLTMAWGNVAPKALSKPMRRSAP